MKKFLSQLLALFTLAVHAHANSGLEALKAATEGSVYEVTGLRGQDQPASWRVTCRENGAIVDYFVNNGRVSNPALAQRSVGGTPFVASKVKYDSTHAFSRANAAAQRAKVGFDSANFRLRSTGGSPFWEMQLTDKSGAVVGYLKISAASGEVMSKRFQPTPTAPGATAYYNPANTGLSTMQQQPQTTQMTGFGGFIQRLLGRR